MAQPHGVCFVTILTVLLTRPNTQAHVRVWRLSNNFRALEPNKIRCASEEQSYTLRILVLSLS